MMRNAGSSFLIVVGLVLSGCGGGSQPSERQSLPVPTPSAPVQPPAQLLRLPNKPGSVRFAAIGDAGRGDRFQYEVSAQMQAYRKVFPFDFVVMLGDNIYDGSTPEDYKQKFELPYNTFLDAGVKF